ncbi:MAG: hypothetical protein R3319_02445, partial [Candidatus Bathyarchaeia archaeon]|nr:hypothetical protein [Candidatus Bathyarchaeia archaeon]
MSERFSCYAFLSYLYLKDISLKEIFISAHHRKITYTKGASEEASVKQEKTKKIVLNIGGMTCVNCA